MKNIEKYIILILSVITVAAIGTAVYFGVNNRQLKEQDKMNEIEKEDPTKNDDKKENLEQKPEEEKNMQEGTAKKCTGKYYGEASGIYKNGLSYDYKYTFILKEDGTYESDFSGVSGDKGTFEIKDEKISFTHQVDVGPDGNMYTDEYIISNDCSYFVIPIDEEKELKVELQ